MREVEGELKHLAQENLKLHSNIAKKTADLNKCQLQLRQRQEEYEVDEAEYKHTVAELTKQLELERATHRCARAAHEKDKMTAGFNAMAAQKHDMIYF